MCTLTNIQPTVSYRRSILFGDPASSIQPHAPLGSCDKLPWLVSTKLKNEHMNKSG